ncbi:MAG: hypothetical protein K6B17_05190 [Treponema sp.]|nr:hypothetical protein [Treponema sp.]
MSEEKYEENEDLSSLEDDYGSTEDSSKFVFPDNLYKVKLSYSFEGLYATLSPGMTAEAGDKVIVPTRYGLDLGICMGKVNTPVGIKPSDVIEISRKATKEDLEKAESLVETEKNAFKIFREKVETHKLDMKLISVHFLVGEPKALFFFSSDNRVDFRELVKDLVFVFKMRIELRQIGVRDESRITGGLGVCGRPFCCCHVSDKLRPVSIRMAKDQNLSLNSMKISGQCGRLLCCLSYEYDWYSEARKKLPSEGIHLHYDGTNFRVIEVNLISSMIKMQGEDGRVLEVNAKRFSKENGKWRVN